MISEAIFFVIGFVIGGFSLWFLKQKEIGAIQNNNENMQKAFSNLSNDINLHINIFNFINVNYGKILLQPIEY